MKKKRLMKRIAAGCLAVLLAAGGSIYLLPARKVVASANKNTTKDASTTSLSDAKKEKEALEAELAAAKKTIENLKDSKEGVEEKVAELNTSLLNISARIATLEGQLADKNTEIADAKEQLAEAEQNLADTKERLAEAQDQKEQQYEDMKVRIQYMYENSQDSYLQMFLEAGSMRELLNAADYISEIENTTGRNSKNISRQWLQSRIWWKKSPGWWSRLLRWKHSFNRITMTLHP